LDENQATFAVNSTSRPGAQMLISLAAAVLFFGLVTPIGIFMRLTGRDRLRLRGDPSRTTYWIIRPARTERPTAMTRQI